MTDSRNRFELYPTYRTPVKPVHAFRRGEKGQHLFCSITLFFLMWTLYQKLGYCINFTVSKPALAICSKDFSGLKSFASDYPEARTVLLYRGDVQYMHGNILVVPVGRYLCSLSPNEPFPDIKWRR